ncbi:MAG: lysophospholipid acyltransferase family protein [Microcoleaceae cyanobacterium]
MNPKSDFPTSNSSSTPIQAEPAEAQIAGMAEDNPNLTPAMVQRAREGLMAAQHRSVRRSIQNALNRMLADASEAELNNQVSQGLNHNPKVSGEFRRYVVRSLIHSLFQVRVEHLERVPQGAAVLAANHLNHIDPFLLLSELYPEPYCHILGDSRTLYNHWWKRLLLDWAGGVIPIERWWREELAVITEANAGREDLVELAAAIQKDVPTGSDVQRLRQIDRAVQKILGRNEGIILFPEGRLGTQEAQLHLPLKRGTALYALRSGVPIVPIALIGTKELYLGKELTIRIGEPLYYPQTRRPKRREINQVLQDLQQAIADLLPPTYQEPTGPKPLRHLLNHMLC